MFDAPMRGRRMGFDFRPSHPHRFPMRHELPRFGLLGDKPPRAPFNSDHTSRDNDERSRAEESTRDVDIRAANTPQARKKLSPSLLGDFPGATNMLDRVPPPPQPPSDAVTSFPPVSGSHDFTRRPPHRHHSNDEEEGTFSRFDEHDSHDNNGRHRNRGGRALVGDSRDRGDFRRGKNDRFHFTRASRDDSVRAESSTPPGGENTNDSVKGTEEDRSQSSSRDM